MYSANSRKLMWWLIGCYANYMNGEDAQKTPTEYQLWEAKKAIQKIYCKASKYKKNNNPLVEFVNKLYQKVPKYEFEKLKKDYVDSIQEYLFAEGEFSLSYALLSQDGANKFINFMFEMLLQNGVPLRMEIYELLEQQDKRNFIFQCLLHKSCCICQDEVTFPHHHKSVAFAGGYNKDVGDLPISPLCRKHHAEYHNSMMTYADWINRYPTYGYITCSDKEKLMLQKVYKGLFAGFKGDGS